MSQIETQQPVPDVEMNKFSKSDMANSAEKNDLEVFIFISFQSTTATTTNSYDLIG